MKKLILLLVTATMFACTKSEPVKPEGPTIPPDEVIVKPYLQTKRG